MITFRHKGDFSKTTRFLIKAEKGIDFGVIDEYGKKIVEALREYTPKRTGKTSESWYYEVKRTKSGASLMFRNSNIQNGENVAILIRYGHGTGSGGYVQGVDYISPALRPVFEELADRLWKEVNGR